MCQPVLILHVAARFTFFFCCGDVKSDATHIYGVIYRKHNRLLGNAESIGVGDWFMNSSVCEALAVSRMPPVNAIYGSLCSNIAYVYMYIDSLPSSSLYSCIVIGDLFAIPGGEYSLRKVLKLQITCKWHVGGNNDAEVTPEETRDELKGCLLPELAAWGAAECCRSTLLLLLLPLLRCCWQRRQRSGCLPTRALGLFVRTKAGSFRASVAPHLFPDALLASVAKIMLAPSACALSAPLGASFCKQTVLPLHCVLLPLGMCCRTQGGMWLCCLCTVPRGSKLNLAKAVHLAEAVCPPQPPALGWQVPLLCHSCHPQTGLLVGRLPPFCLGQAT